MKKKPKQPARVRHESTVITLRRAAVDKGIVPLLQWMNSFAYITTEWSCQGHADEDTAGNRPYVVFYCTDNLHLARALDKLSGFATVEVEFYEPAGSLRYVARFPNLLALERFIGFIPKGRKEST